MGTRPDWAPATAWDDKAGLNREAFDKYWKDEVSPKLVRDAAEQVRRNALPKAEDYKLELPKDYKLPEGLTFELDTKAPELARFRQLAAEKGLDQETVTQLMGLYGETQVSSRQAIEAARAAEVQKLGANGPSRVTAIQNFLTSIVGDERARAIGAGMASARQVEAFEALASRYLSQGAGQYSRAHSEPPPAASPSDEDWGRMSAAERLDYARRHDQSKFMNGGSGR